jgi:hypothetical protein
MIAVCASPPSSFVVEAETAFATVVSVNTGLVPVVVGVVVVGFFVVGGA